MDVNTRSMRNQTSKNSEPKDNLFLGKKRKDSKEKPKKEKKKILHFCSGNAKKFEEVNAIFKKELPDVEIIQLPLDIPELQGDPENIVKDKLVYAINKHKGPLIVEDTSLCFNSLHGLPGPYIKDFLNKLGTEGLYKLVSAFDDKTGYAQCIFGMKKNKKDEAKIFIGRTNGQIVEPRGPKNFGWDPNFQPDGFEKTYAEIDSEVKNSISHRFKALKELTQWLRENPNYLI